MLTKEKHKTTYWSELSDTTARKPSSSDSTTGTGLMAFLRGLRLAIERKWKREENKWVKTWRRRNKLKANFISTFDSKLGEQ